MTEACRTDASAAIGIRRNVVDDVVGVCRVAGEESRDARDAAAQEIEVQIVSSPPCDVVIGAGRVAANADGSDNLTSLRIQCKPSSEDVDAADLSSDQRVVRRAESCDGPAYATDASTGLLSCNPNRLPPGCTAEYKFAVDSAGAPPFTPLCADPSRLNAFAVLAFWAEMTRLPGHCAPRLSPVNTTAQTTPSRSTIVAHMFMFRPLASASVAAASAAFNCE